MHITVITHTLPTAQVSWAFPPSHFAVTLGETNTPTRAGFTDPVSKQPDAGNERCRCEWRPACSAERAILPKIPKGFGHVKNTRLIYLPDTSLMQSSSTRPDRGPPSVLLFFFTLLHARLRPKDLRMIQMVRCRRAAEIVVQAREGGWCGRGRGGETLGPGGYSVCKHAGRVTEINAGQSSRRCGSYLSCVGPPASRASVNCESRFCLWDNVNSRRTICRL